MTPQQIIDNSRIPGTQSILVLGSFEKRVTVYAQQVRALNLVDAILSEHLVRPKGGKVAIIGGGAAGITAAVALARTCPELEWLDVFERNSDILQKSAPAQSAGQDEPRRGQPDACSDLSTDGVWTERTAAPQRHRCEQIHRLSCEDAREGYAEALVLLVGPC